MVWGLMRFALLTTSYGLVAATRGAFMMSTRLVQIFLNSFAFSGIFVPKTPSKPLRWFAVVMLKPEGLFFCGGSLIAPLMGLVGCGEVRTASDSSAMGFPEDWREREPRIGGQA